MYAALLYRFLYLFQCSQTESIGIGIHQKASSTVKSQYNIDVATYLICQSKSKMFIIYAYNIRYSGGIFVLHSSVL